MNSDKPTRRPREWKVWQGFSARKVLDKVVPHLLAFGAGMIISVLFLIEGLDLQISDGAATLLGAAGGAFIAIGGADFVQRRTEARRRREVSLLLLPMLEGHIQIWRSRRAFVRGHHHPNYLNSMLRFVRSDARDLAAAMSEFSQTVQGIDLLASRHIAAFMDGSKLLGHYLENPGDSDPEEEAAMAADRAENADHAIDMVLAPAEAMAVYLRQHK